MKKLIIMLLLSLVLVVGCQAENNDPALEAVEAAEAAEAVQADAEVAETPAENPVGYEAGTWITDYQLALNYAEQLDRTVLINFTGSDWCQWCFRLRDEVFTLPEFKAYAKENLVLLTIDFPSKKKLPPAEAQANQALAEQYGIQGYPTILLLNPQGKEIARTGYQYGGAAAYVQHLQELITEG